MEQAIHPSRCPPLNLEFLWKLYHQRQQLDNCNTALVASDEERIQILQSQGFPIGLASLILQHSQKCPIRVWLIGNSGTMHQNDGHIVSQSSQGKVEIVDCSRWQEICCTLQWHAELASWCQTPMAIRFLRDPGVQVGPQQLGISASKHYSSNEEVTRLKTLLHKIRPTGGTSPIHSHLRQIFPSIQALVPILEQSAKRIVLCVCTDAIPTDVDGIEDPDMMQEFLLTLQQLVDWPVQIVLRLSTDEERVVQFYQNMTMQNDSMIAVQVLDDYVSECRQIQQHNPWLNYGYPLHLCREEGIQKPVLETLSKRPLSALELLEAVRLVFGQNHPQDQISYRDFRKLVHSWIKETGALWNPIKKRFVPWIDLKKMDKCYKNTISSKNDRGNNCMIM